jgi:hypothetical protein
MKNLRKLRLIVSYFCMLFSAAITLFVFVMLIVNVRAFTIEYLMVLIIMAIVSGVIAQFYYPHKYNG